MEIAEKMLLNFDKKLTPQIRTEVQVRGKTVFEVVTMASLLEKEVRSKEDKELAAGVLWKRLEHGIFLQVDATVAYITDKSGTQISRADLEIDSPYNTYVYAGLPLGPISNPGMESILAALYPKENEFWYYLATPKGETLFSRTLEEHNLKKVKYLK